VQKDVLVLVCALVGRLTAHEGAVHAEPMRPNVQHNQEDEPNAIGWIQVGKDNNKTSSPTAVSDHVENCPKTRALIEKARKVTVSSVQEERSDVEKKEKTVVVKRNNKTNQRKYNTCVT
jgi:hypothetical protein